MKDGITTALNSARPEPRPASMQPSPTPASPRRLPNPFARPVVDGPRDMPATAESIHRDTLEALLEAFDELATQPLPRLQRGPLALRVLSQMPGSGKSHLLGRLWRALNGRAIVVYLRAHQDRHAFWRRILERLVQELEQPEATDQRVLQHGHATQLDSLARHLLANLLEHGARSGRIKAPPALWQAVRSGTPQAMGRFREQLPKLMTMLEALIAPWVGQFADAGLQLARDPVAWLKVLTRYTLHRPGDSQRNLALAWLRGNELERHEAEQLALTPAQCRLQPDNAGDSSINESAFLCVKDLCALSAFFRPLVFAFDQTEIYGQDPALARAFGATVARLQDECINQLTLVTSNEQPWRHSLSPHFEQADLDRFDAQRVRVLKGIDPAQAAELVTVKLRSAGHAEADIHAFLQRPWFAALFADPAVRPLPRTLEQAAARALAHPEQDPAPAGPEGASPAKPTPEPTPPDSVQSLETAWQAHRARLRATPRALAFDAGVLQWAAEQGVAGVPGLSVRQNFQRPNPRVQVCWELDDGRSVFLVVDDNNHWSHWRAVVWEYERHAQAERERGRQALGRVLRHHSLKPLGDGARKQFDLPAAQGLRLQDLSDAQMADLYAAQALFAEVCQGDLPQVSTAQLWPFLGAKLAPWVQAMVAAEPGPTPPAAPPAGPATSPPRAAPRPVPEPRPPGDGPTSASTAAPRTGGDVHLTVTQLVCACARPGWLAAWQIGQAPDTAPQGGAWTQGARLHLVAQAFAQWATAPDTLADAASRATPAQLLPPLQALGGRALLHRLMRRGQADPMRLVQQHLQQLAQHFSEARAACTGFTDWRDVFLAQEHALRRVPLATHAGRTVWVSGRLDSLRHVLPHGARLVDYKFARADAPEEALLQLAIYQRMLLTQHRLRVDGEVVFMTPPATTLTRDAEALARLFDAQVQPVLNRMLGRPGPGSEPVPTPPSAPASAPAPARAAGLVKLGHKRHHPQPEVSMPLLDLARHSAVLGSSGSGKTTAALHLIEQVLEQGVPAVLLDRKGDLCRYAQPEAWTDPSWPPGAFMDPARRAALHQRLAIRVYTPGAIQGRGLRLPLAPNGLDQLPEEERDEIARDAAAAFAAALSLTKTADQPKLAVLVRVFQILARRVSGRGIGLDDVLGLLSQSDPDLEAAIGVLDPKLCRKLAEQVQTFHINNGKLLDERAEALNWTQWLTPRSDGRIPLTIVSTKFLGDDGSALFWVAQFFLELLRHVSRHPADRLQGLLMIDEADLYMPATKSPATKAPLAGLLRRARSAGVGLMLCTQSPGDLDYKGRDNIRNWLIGLVQQATALKKLEGVLSDSRVQPEHISKQKVGQFIFAAEGRGDPITVPPNLVKTQQLSEPEILQVARDGRRA